MSFVKFVHFALVHWHMAMLGDHMQAQMLYVHLISLTGFPMFVECAMFDRRDESPFGVMQLLL